MIIFFINVLLLIWSGYGCPECSRLKSRLTLDQILEKLPKEFLEINDYSRSIYNGYEKLFEVICLKHGPFYPTPHNHLAGHGCPKCATEKAIYSGFSFSSWIKSSENSKEFDSFKVYILECWNENEKFIKIGKTFRKVKERFCGESSLPYNYKILDTFLFIDGLKCSLFECALHQNFKSFKYMPLYEFGGAFECYTLNIPLEEVTSVLQNLESS